jgi:HEAT repeats
MMFLRDTTEIIWAFTGAVLGLIVCVGLSAIVRQTRHNSTGSSHADRWENATDSVLGFVDGDEIRMARFSKLLNVPETRPIVIEALSNIARSHPDCSVRLRDRNVDVAILRQWVSDSLEDKDAGRRAHACEVVATLRLRACRGMILAATSDEDVNVKVSATRAMAVIDPESAVGVLLGLIEEEGTWAADLLADLLQRIPANATEAVVQRAREWGATPALVKLLASSPSALANDVLLGALETDDPELRARTAEAIHASSPLAVAALCGLLTDPHEGTRLSAVRSLSRARNPEALLTLSSALSDSSRLVRFAAASGIAGTAGGAEVLTRVVAGTDRNAAEAAELALWRLNSDAVNVVPKPSEPMPSGSESSIRLAGWKGCSGGARSEAEMGPASIEESVVLEPTALKPTVPTQPEQTEQTESDPTVLKPTVSVPIVLKPTVSEPTVLKPTVPESTGPKPTVKKPTVMEPTVSEPTGPKPTVKKPTVMEPTVSKQTMSKTEFEHHELEPVRPRSASAKSVTERRTGAPSSLRKPGRRSDEVLEWLEAFLVASDGVASAPLVKAAAAAEGIAERTLERVRPMIATSARQGFGEAANWQLIEHRAVAKSGV